MSRRTLTQVIHSVGLYTARLIDCPECTVETQDVFSIPTTNALFRFTEPPIALRRIRNAYTDAQRALIRFLWSTQSGDRLMLTNRGVSATRQTNVAGVGNTYGFTVNIDNATYVNGTSPILFNNIHFDNPRILIYEDWRYRGIAHIERQQTDEYVKFRNSDNTLIRTKLKMRDIKLMGTLENYDRQNLEDIMGYETYETSRNQSLSDDKESATYLVALIARPDGNSDELVSHYFPACKFNHEGKIAPNPRNNRRMIEFGIDVLKSSSTPTFTTPFDGFEFTVRENQ